ncbi:MAG: 23S rRNA (adenine(2503)-C(2))-methyltransferase RlmN [Candidatus Marinimicrobia bacterium]|nr:23S rRNA (adenine(2503)-C(2))-methyltransferase RlmN [Candidatus Neomarinimicrobiota bacterium]
MTEKTIITGYTLPELEEWATGIGEKPFRARQLYQWIYQKNARSFDEMLNLSKDLRKKLAETAALNVLSIDRKMVSQKDGSIKYLFRLHDGLAVESVYMEEGGRKTVCLSTMVGCPIACPYCATGSMGFKKNLSSGEIIGQLVQIRRDLNVRVSNIVFMGMGEPFLNYENVIKAANIMNSELGPEIAARRITISTAGIAPAIRRFTHENHRFKLAVSLNGTTDLQRDELVPINRKYPLNELLAAVRDYTKKSHRRVTFEYILIAGFNDSADDARRLTGLLGQIPCKINVIPYNENEFLPYRAPSEKTLNDFLRHLYKAPFAVTVRRSKGQDIAAACGQLATRTRNRFTRAPRLTSSGPLQNIV